MRIKRKLQKYLVVTELKNTATGEWYVHEKLPFTDAVWARTYADKARLYWGEQKRSFLVSMLCK